MSNIVKHSGTITASTGAAYATTDTPTFVGKLLEVAIGPRNEAVSSSNIMIFGRGSSDDLIINPADQFPSTGTIYRFQPRKSVNVSSSNATVPVTSGGLPNQLGMTPLVDERVSISVAPASSAGTPTWAYTVYVEGVSPSTI